MIVLCTGVVRSGSGWTYNAAKLLLARHSDNYACGYSDDIGRAITAAKQADHLIIKCHRPDSLGRNLIHHRGCLTLHSFREPLDCLASSLESFNGEFERHLEAVVTGFELLKFELENGGCHFLWYDEITQFGAARVQAIADYLGLEMPPSTIAEIAESLARENVLKTIAKLPIGERRLPLGKFNWSQGTLFTRQQIRTKPKTIEQLTTPAQRKKLILALKGLVDGEGRLLELVKNIGCIAAYYHNGALIMEGEEPPQDAQETAPDQNAATATQLADHFDAPDGQDLQDRQEAPAETVTSQATPLQQFTNNLIAQRLADGRSRYLPTLAEDGTGGIPILSATLDLPEDFDPGFTITKLDPEQLAHVRGMAVPVATPPPSQYPMPPPISASLPTASPTAAEPLDLERLAASGARLNPAHEAALRNSAAVATHAPNTSSKPRTPKARRPGINEVV